jgi:murein L,D-transpeptidase YafK
LENFLGLSISFTGKAGKCYENGVFFTGDTMEERIGHFEELKRKLEKELSAYNCDREAVQLFLRAFKAEQVLEVWLRPGEDDHWLLMKYFPFCTSSGELGPKREEGDYQIPEGIYHIDRFNPKSKYHLSLGLNYPNASDRIRGHPEQPGSDIFIHGGCETVGCIPITNGGIEEVYLLAVWAGANGQEKIPVHIYPFKFGEANWNKYGPDYLQHHSFWKELEKVYVVFERSKQLPKTGISEDGTYELMGR